MAPTRQQAWETLTRYTKSESLLRHALAVEASTAAYARKLGADEEQWRVAALLHDFDYEMHPTLDKHPQDGAPILREEGYPEEIVETVLSHAEHLSLPRDTPSIGLDVGFGMKTPEVVLQTVTIRVDDRQLDLVWRGALPYPGVDWLPEMKTLTLEVT